MTHRQACKSDACLLFCLANSKARLVFGVPISFDGDLVRLLGHFI